MNSWIDLKLVLLIDMSSVEKPIHLMQLETSMRCLVEMWQVSALNVDGFEKFRSSDQPRGKLEVKVDSNELETVVEVDSSQTTRQLSNKVLCFDSICIGPSETNRQEAGQVGTMGSTLD